jgi:protoporphyrinogen oxidase
VRRHGLSSGGSWREPLEVRAPAAAAGCRRGGGRASPWLLLLRPPLPRILRDAEERREEKKQRKKKPLNQLSRSFDSLIQSAARATYAGRTNTSIKRIIIKQKRKKKKTEKILG